MEFIVKGKRRGDEAASIEVTPPDVGEIAVGVPVRALVQVRTRSNKLRDPATVTGLVSNDPAVAATFVAPNQVEIVSNADADPTAVDFTVTGDAT